MTFRRMTVLAAAAAAVLAPMTARQAAAQDLNLSVSRPARPPVERWREDYRFLADPAKQTDFWDPIRYVPLGTDAWIQFGGEYRLRYENFITNPSFGLAGHGHDDSIQQRILLHGDLHIGRSVRVFGQIADTRTWGKEQPLGGADESRVDLQQLFADVRIDTAEGQSLTIRGGRQEIGLGAQRLITVREAPNVRLSFDGVRAIYQAQRWSSTAFYTRPVTAGRSSFDDRANRAVQFWGLYNTVSLYRDGDGTAVGADLYGLGYRNDAARWGSVAGYEKRYTVGARLFGTIGPVDLNWEFAHQSGNFADQTIRAFAIGTDTGYTFKDTPWRPRVGLRFDVASGDENRSDRKLNSFHPLFPRNGFYMDGSMTTLSNLVALGTSLRVAPSQSVTVQGEVQVLRRQSGQDAVYSSGPRALPRTTANGSDDIGRLYKLDLTWRPTANVTTAFQYARYDAGDAIRRAGGKDADYFQVRAGYLF